MGRKRKNRLKKMERIRVQSAAIARNNAAELEERRAVAALAKADREIAKKAKDALSTLPAHTSGKFDLHMIDNVPGDTRTKDQCAYGTCALPRTGNGLCRNHQPPEGLTKLAVTRAKLVIAQRA